MNEQHRRSKEVSRLSDRLFITLYVHYNQPQIRPAIISKIYGNGVSVLIPFFDMTFTIPFFDKTGNATDRMKEWTGTDKVESEVFLENGKTLIDKDVTSTIVSIVLKDADNRECCRFDLYQRIMVGIETVETNPVTHAKRLEVYLVKTAVISKEREKLEGTIRDVMKNVEGSELSAKKDTYHSIRGEEKPRFESTKRLMEQQIEQIQSRLDFWNSRNRGDFEVAVERRHEAARIAVFLRWIQNPAVNTGGEVEKGVRGNWRNRGNGPWKRGTADNRREM